MKTRLNLGNTANLKMESKEEIAEKKWLAVKKHYEAAYKKTGFQFNKKPSNSAIEYLYQAMIKLADAESFHRATFRPPLRFLRPSQD